MDFSTSIFFCHAKETHWKIENLHRFFCLFLCFSCKVCVKRCSSGNQPCDITDGIDLRWMDLPPSPIPAGCHLAAVFETCLRHPAKNWMPKLRKFGSCEQSSVHLVQGKDGWFVSNDLLVNPTSHRSKIEVPKRFYSVLYVLHCSEMISWRYHESNIPPHAHLLNDEHDASCRDCV